MPIMEDPFNEETTTFEGSTRSDTTQNDNSDTKGGNFTGEVIDWEDGGTVDLIAEEVIN